MQLEVNGKLRNTQILLSASDIQKRVQTIAQEINQQYPPEETLILFVVLHGALLFAADLIRHLRMPTEIESVRIRSYEGNKSGASIELLSVLPQSLTDKNVLIVEDIIDTGRSIQFLTNLLAAQKVKSLRVCTFLNKPDDHLIPVKPDFVGFDIGKNFVIGYGFDLDGKYRNLPYIAEII